MTDLTLGANTNLAAPMVPVLPWETRHEYHLDWGSDGLHAVAHVIQLMALPDHPAGRPWRAYCIGPRVPGPEPAEFADWFATPEDAVAAVETHIAAHVEMHLSEVHQHNWVDVTRVESRNAELLCADCGQRKEEPR
jgi:hypothetical protein